MAAGILTALSVEDIQRTVTAISYVAKHGGLGSIVLPHPQTGEPTLCEFDQDAALDLISEFNDAMSANPNHRWTSSPLSSREAAPEGANSDVSLLDDEAPEGWLGRKQ